MDPLGATASVLTIVDVAYKLGKLIKSANNAPEELISLSNQVSDLKLVISEVESLDRDSVLVHHSSETLRKLLIGARIKITALDGFAEELLKIQSRSSLQVQKLKWATSYKKRAEKLLAEFRDIQQNLCTVLGAKSMANNYAIKIVLDRISLDEVSKLQMHHSNDSTVIRDRAELVNSTPCPKVQLGQEARREPNQSTPQRSVKGSKSVGRRSAHLTERTETGKIEDDTVAITTANKSSGSMNVFLHAHEEQHMTCDALEAGHVDMCTSTQLIQAGASLDIEDHTGRAPKYLAWERILGATQFYSSEFTPETVQGLRNLFERKLDPEDLEFPPLHSIILGLQDGDLEEEMQKPETDVNAQDCFGYTALAWAAHLNHNRALRLLLQYRADPDIADFNPFKPIDHSIFTRDPSSLLILLAGRVDISPDEHGFNPLQHAAYHHNDLRFIKPLIAAGCPVDFRTYESSDGTGGHTPLARATLTDRDVVANYLCELGANINNIDSNGNSIVMLAVQFGANKVLRTLLARAAATDTVNFQGYTVIHTAADSGRANIETLEILREARIRNIDVNAREKSGATALQILQRRGDVTQEFRIAFADFVKSIKPPEAVVYGPFESYRLPGSFPAT